MNSAALIACAVFTAAIVAVLLARRTREIAARRAQAVRHGWQFVPRPADLRGRLHRIELMQLGHSRRVNCAFEAPGPLWIFEYVYETGFESRRRDHRFVVAARRSGHACRGAAITADPWLQALARHPATQALPLSGTDAHAPRVALVRDAAEWSERLQTVVGPWLAAQPAGRTYELIPGYVVAYQRGSIEDAAAGELAATVEDLDARLIVAAQQHVARQDSLLVDI